MIVPLSKVTVTAHSQVMGNSKKLHVMMEARALLPGGKVTNTRGKTILKGGSSKVLVFLRS